MSSSEPRTRLFGPRAPDAEKAADPVAPPTEIQGAADAPPAVDPARPSSEIPAGADAPVAPGAEPRTQPQTEAGLTPAPDACPRCGAALRPEQEWCLNCGTAARTRVVGAASWRTPVVVVAGVLAVALAGLVLAFLVVSGDSQRVGTTTQTGAIATPTPAATTPAPGEPGATPGATVPPATSGEQPVPTPTASPAPGATATPVPTPTPSATPSPTPTPTATPDGSSGAGVGSWPSGESAFTVVLVSATTRSAANRRARALAADGTDVGVLDSDDFRSLRGGYFVVFSGQYETRASAEDALGGLSGKAAGAYVRRVTPR